MDSKPYKKPNFFKWGLLRKIEGGQVEILKINSKGKKPAYYCGRIQSIKKINNVLHIKFFWLAYQSIGTKIWKKSQTTEKKINLKDSSVTDSFTINVNNWHIKLFQKKLSEKITFHAKKIRVILKKEEKKLQ